VKKLISGKRPVGATHGGSRPRTAPASTKDRWKTERVCFSFSFPLLSIAVIVFDSFM